MNIVVFVSGRGSNLQSIINSPDLRNLIAIKFVISNIPDCGAFAVARKNGIDVIPLGNGENNLTKNFSQLLEMFKQNNIELIVLAGFLKMIPEFFIREFEGKIINIHPALLPKFGGQGMYGMNVHKAVFDAHEKTSGASVHFVNDKYDEGEIICQEAIDITNFTSPEEIAAEVLKIEHRILPFVIKKFAQKKLTKKNGSVCILD